MDELCSGMHFRNISFDVSVEVFVGVVGRKLDKVSTAKFSSRRGGEVLALGPFLVKTQSMQRLLTLSTCFLVTSGMPIPRAVDKASFTVLPGITS